MTLAFNVLDHLTFCPYRYPQLCLYRYLSFTFNLKETICQLPVHAYKKPLFDISLNIPGGKPRQGGWRCAAHLPKPLPLIYDENLWFWKSNQKKLFPQFKTRVLKPYLYLLPKRLKIPTLWGCTYLYRQFKGVSPPPRCILFIPFFIYCRS